MSCGDWSISFVNLEMYIDLMNTFFLLFFKKIINHNQLCVLSLCVVHEICLPVKFHCFVDFLYDLHS